MTHGFGPAGTAVGEWWPPDRPDLAFMGSLTFGPGEHPCVSSSRPASSGNGTDCNAVLWGDVVGVGPLTLLATDHGSVLVVGARLRTVEELQVQWMSLRHTALPQTVLPQTVGAASRTTVLSGPSERRVGAILRPSGSLDIVTRWGIPFETVWTKFATPIDAFLQIAAGRPGGWTSIETQLHPDGPTVALHRKSIHGQAGPGRPTRWALPLFEIDDLGEQLGPVLRAWLELHRDFEVPIGEILAGWAEAAPDQRGRRMAMAVEGLSELAGAWLHPPMAIDEWAALKASLSAGGLKNEILVKIEQAVFRPSFADQLDAVIASLAALDVRGISWLEQESSRVKRVRNSFSHAESHQHRPGLAEVEAAALAAEAMALALLIRALPLADELKRSLVCRAIEGPDERH